MASTNLCGAVVSASSSAPSIGVLALQGGVHEHKVMLSRLGCSVREVRQVRRLLRVPTLRHALTPTLLSRPCGTL